MTRDEMSKAVWNEVVGLTRPEIIALLVDARFAFTQKWDRVGVWTTIKPSSPCLLLTRSVQANEQWRYNFYIIEMVDGEDENEKPSRYLGWLNEDGEELGDLYGDLRAGEYMVIAEHTEKGKV